MPAFGLGHSVQLYLVSTTPASSSDVFGWPRTLSRSLSTKPCSFCPWLVEASFSTGFSLALSLSWWPMYALPSPPRCGHMSAITC